MKTRSGVGSTLAIKSSACSTGLGATRTVRIACLALTALVLASPLAAEEPPACQAERTLWAGTSRRGNHSSDVWNGFDAAYRPATSCRNGERNNTDSISEARMTKATLVGDLHLLDSEGTNGSCASDGCDSCCSCLADDSWRPGGGIFENWRESTVVFLTGDAWKNIFDDDDNNNFGFRTGANTSFALPGPWTLRGQIGASYGAYDFHGREQLFGRDDPIEQQVFTTTGIFKRSQIEQGDPLAWGVVYDLMVSVAAGERADDIRLAQLRAYVGHALSKSDELGVWMAFRLTSDYAPAQRVRVNATDQVNGFWHRRWSSGGDTFTYVGWADDPGSVVIGLRGLVPLNNRFGIVGNVQYIIPSTTGGDTHPTLPVDDIFNQEAWNISFGVVFYPGGKAASPSVSGIATRPLLPVADNGSFSFQADMFR